MNIDFLLGALTAFVLVVVIMSIVLAITDFELNKREKYNNESHPN
ncbi:TPA: hypothetical protein ACGORU_002021 [Streptococcus suis]